MTASQPTRVLVVEDNQVAAENLATLLMGSGYEVQISHDASAIDLAQVFQPDVVLLDINLPQMDGISMAHHLRGRDGGEETLIIAVTGYDDALYRLLAQEAGIDHYLVKPIDTDALETLLRTKAK